MVIRHGVRTVDLGVPYALGVIVHEAERLALEIDGGDDGICIGAGGDILAGRNLAKDRHRGRSIIRGLDRTIRLAPACAVSPNHGPSRIEIEVIGENVAAGLNHLPWLKPVCAALTEKHGDGRAAHATAMIRDRPGRCGYRSRKDVIGSKCDPNGADGAIGSRQHGHGH